MTLRKLSFWTVAALVGAGAVIASFGAAVNAGLSEGWGGALSGYAAGLMSVVLTVAAAALFDHFVLDSFDLLEELKEGNVAVAIAFVGLLLAAALSFPAG